MNQKLILEMAAKKFGCQVEDLLSFSIKEDCVAIIAPTGQKFTYDLAELEAIHAQIRKAAPAKGAEAAAERKPEHEPNAQPVRSTPPQPSPSSSKIEREEPEPESQTKKPPADKPPADETPALPKAATGGRRRRGRPKKAE